MKYGLKKPLDIKFTTLSSKRMCLVQVTHPGNTGTLFKSSNTCVYFVKK